MKISEKGLRILIKVLRAVVIVIIAGVLIFLALQISGRSKLYRGKGSNAPRLELSALTETIDVSQAGNTQNKNANGDTNNEASETGEKTSTDSYTWQEGDIRYQGSIYRYNEDMLTFLFLGIDKNSEVKTVQQGIKGGQSDAIFLLVLNPHTKTASVIGIPRDTMTEIDVYNENGDYKGVGTAQIALQHGYGDGGKISCERSEAAVSNLFYGLNINGYCAINMAAIPSINDAVGGVDVTALETMSFSQGKFVEGETVHLKGKQAYYYLHDRDITSEGSAGRRLERQKQYLTEYVSAAKAVMKKDITFPVKLFGTLSKYMVTDVTVDEVSYLAGQALDYTFDEESFYSLQGEVKQGEKYEEFYADETALYELILQVFYEKVDGTDAT